MFKKKKLKILLLDVGIVFMDILEGVFIGLFAILTFPIWGFMALGEILGEVVMNCPASRRYAEDMKEINSRKEKEWGMSELSMVIIGTYT